MQFSHDTKIRVVYADTDKMGYSYYGNYTKYYEIGRTEMLRSLGISYRDIEEQGILMPVISMHIDYLKPAFYDELLTVRTIIKEVPRARIQFEYEIYNDSSELINKGITDLVFINKERNRPQAAPDFLISLFEEKLNPPV